MGIRSGVCAAAVIAAVAAAPAHAGAIRVPLDRSLLGPGTITIR